MSGWDSTIRYPADGAYIPVASTTQKKYGTYAYKFEEYNPYINVCCEWNYSMCLSYGPNITGQYVSGFYSFWLYVDSGFTGEVYSDWRTILNWFTTGGVINPILNLELHGGNPTTGGNTLQLSVLLKNAQSGCYTAPTIANYDLAGGGYYFMTATSPNGITAFPTQQWVHVECEYVMAASNGAFRVWQDGIKIIDLTHANFNTAMASSNCVEGDGDMLIQFGMYNAARGAAQVIYMDDFRYCDQRYYPYIT